MVKKEKDKYKSNFKDAVKVKDILRKNKMSVKIEEVKAPSVLGDENRFFKGEMEATKKSMFFE